MVTVDLEQPDGRVEALRRMLRIREFENTAGDHFADGELPGFLHLYIGEEAVAVGACAALDADDYIASTHRGHGHCIAKGLNPQYMMAELFAKSEGYCNGKGGSMHIADIQAGMLGANGVVGAGPPLATGAALAADLDDSEQVALAFSGDGAIAQGQIHEALNLAATWSLPMILVVENNQYAEYRPYEDHHNIKNLSDTAAAYDIPGVTIDGMDVVTVFETVREARERALKGNGPTFIEAETYRYHGHVEGDQEEYRTQDEVEDWRANRDPIETFKERLFERGELTEAEYDEMNEEIQIELEEAVEFAKEAAEPDIQLAYEDMFGTSVPDIHHHRDRLRSDGGNNTGDLI